MQQWLVDNLFSIISLTLTVIGFFIAFVKQNERTKIQLKANTDAIASLQEALNEEKDKNRENYNKLDRQTDETFKDLLTRMEISNKEFRSRLDKIDEMNLTMKNMSQDMSEMKVDVKENKECMDKLKVDVERVKSDLEHVKTTTEETKSDLKELQRLHK